MRFDQHHVGAHDGQEATAVGGRHAARALDDLDTGKRALVRLR